MTVAGWDRTVRRTRVHHRALLSLAWPQTVDRGAQGSQNAPAGPLGKQSMQQASTQGTPHGTLPHSCSPAQYNLFLAFFLAAPMVGDVYSRCPRHGAARCLLAVASSDQHQRQVQARWNWGVHLTFAIA